jgi:hypothetical protein
MPSADQVPVTTAHSTMPWPEWVVLITGSTGSALRAVRPFQPFTSHRELGATSFTPQMDADGPRVTPWQYRWNLLESPFGIAGMGVLKDKSAETWIVGHRRRHRSR